MDQLIVEHGICPKLGFLSPARPLTAFANKYYSDWDRIAAQFPRLIESRQLATHIRLLPILSVIHLENELEYRRAYVVLGFLIQAHVWGSAAQTPSELVPSQLAEPFLAVCQELGVQSILSYSGLVLWNWTTIDSARNDGQFPDLAELTSLVSFTGTRGEDAFYHVPALVEADGGPLIPLLLKATEAAQANDFTFVQEALETCTARLAKLGKHLAKLYGVLDADMFYHQLRPFLAGGKGMESKGLPRGIVFQRADGSEVEVKCIGGSAAQSSLFPFLDHLLGVEHEEAKSSVSVFQEMRAYMPEKHRKFLDAVSRLPSLRSFVERQSQDAKIRIAYNDCMAQLRLWRGKHIAIISKYIIQPAKAAEMASLAKHYGASLPQPQAPEDMQGTGGSTLIPFLRQSRDETIGLPSKCK